MFISLRPVARGAASALYGLAVVIDELPFALGRLWPVFGNEDGESGFHS
jgi:hypothetical protein